MSQPRAKRSSSTTLPTHGVATGKNPVSGVIRRYPSNVTEHRHLALEDQLRDVFHRSLLEQLVVGHEVISPIPKDIKNPFKI